MHTIAARGSLLSHAFLDDRQLIGWMYAHSATACMLYHLFGSNCALCGPGESGPIA
jgi:hypothetical protein